MDNSNVELITKMVLEAVEKKNAAQSGEGFLVPIGVSARHIHLTQEHVEILFGEGYHLTKFKELMGGQFASNEKVTIVGLKLRAIENVRVLGPVRKNTQVEISATDAISLGVKAPIRESGNIAGSAPIAIIGPKGAVYLNEGCIVAKRHIHMAPKDAMAAGVLLRPRYGDYCYNQYEFEQLKEEVQMYCEMGADGVVIGMLNPDGTLDTERMAELIKAAGNKEKALHRAFDVCIDPMKALEEAIDLEFDTILTSGQKETAWEGKEMLKALQEKSAGRIEILAASGIGAESIEKLLPYTGITSYHMSGKIVVDSMMKYRKEGIGLGLSERGDYALWQTSEEEIVKAVKVLKTTG